MFAHTTNNFPGSVPNNQSSVNLRIRSKGNNAGSDGCICYIPRLNDMTHDSQLYLAMRARHILVLN